MSTERVDPRRESPPDATPEQPNQGAITVNIDGDEVVLTEAVHWVEDGEHIIASTEFQVAADAPNFREVFFQFVDRLLDESRSLNTLIRSGEAAENERDEGLRLAERIAEIVTLEEHAQRRREAAHRAFRSRRLSRGRHWQVRHNKRAPSAKPLPV